MEKRLAIAFPLSRLVGEVTGNALDVVDVTVSYNNCVAPPFPGYRRLARLTAIRRVYTCASLFDRRSKASRFKL